MPGQPEQRPAEPAAGRGAFPLGEAVALADLDADPHPVLARLRQHEPVSWLPALNGWLVTRRDLALQVLRDSAAFTVDDPRFSTARVVGPSMLSLDGAEHGRHRGPFTRGFSHGEVRSRLAGYVEAEAARLVAALRPPGAADLRPGLAGPLAVGVVAEALGLGQTDPGAVLEWYGAIVAAVSAQAGAPGQRAEGDVGDVGDVRDVGVSAAGAQAFRLLDTSLRAVIGPGGDRSSLLADAAGAGNGSSLSAAEVVSNAAVLMFGGIETTEGMIDNAILHLLSHPAQLALVIEDPGLVPDAVEESLRLEPAAAVVDRYATRDLRIGTAAIQQGDLVTVSLAGAGRDPAVFPDPDAFDIRRPNSRLHLAFAHGPHFCLGAHLARLEAQAAMRAVLRLPGLRLDPDHPTAPRGLVFRKPPALHVRWDRPAF
ncbi:MAG TPA: cytochrome P450 [Streptosporangiaceae bacterium]|nr:cytochrome P450 [Streptosporangiaceae bacterium]